MKGFRVLLSVAVGIVTYLLLCIFLGQTGVLEYQRLSVYSQRLGANISDLDHVRQRLDDRIQSLQSDPQNIHVLSRDLGYFSPGEKLLRIKGYNPDQQVTTPGNMVYQTDKPVNRKPLFRGIAFTVALITFFVMLLDGASLRDFGRGVHGRVRERMARSSSPSGASVRPPISRHREHQPT